MNAIDRLRLRLIRLLLPKLWSTYSCANRRTWKARLGTAAEVTVTVRHLGGPDGYSREELVEMLWLVRKHEAVMDWKVPEPTNAEIAYARASDAS